MPIGIIVDAAAVILGGAAGAFAGNRLTEAFKDKINLIFALCSMSMELLLIKVNRKF